MYFFLFNNVMHNAAVCYKGYMVSVIATQLCYCSLKVAVDNK